MEFMTSEGVKCEGTAGKLSLVNIITEETGNDSKKVKISSISAGLHFISGGFYLPCSINNLYICPAFDE